jgi:hypothetical protein
LAAAAAACMLVVAMWFSLQSRATTQQLADARQALDQATSERDRLARAVAFFEAPETKQVNFGDPQNAPPRGNVYLHPRLGVLLVASNLPALPADRTYEMWVIRRGENPRPAGLFRSDQDGTALHVQSEALDVAEIVGVAVTVEPAAGSQVPTPPILFVAQPAA